MGIGKVKSVAVNIVSEKKNFENQSVSGKVKSKNIVTHSLNHNVTLARVFIPAASDRYTVFLKINVILIIN